ncbi:MAG TPA: DUF3179 domain-containing protein, partial [Anaerolineae bacterium]|nr:DUF3179 domain-containing protein [Anaerolineae bacterium]
MTFSKRPILLTFLLFTALILAACSSTEPAPPASDDTSNEVAALPTTKPTDAPTDAPAEPTDAPPATDSPAPTEQPQPTAEPVATEPPQQGVDNRNERLKSLTKRWRTDWTITSIDFDEILSGGPPRDGIPSIDEPKFIDSAEADEWLADNEPVIALEINGDARAYPLQIITWHEIVNDTVGDTPVIVTFCPLCNSAIVFERIVNGEPTEFGVSGLLRNSDLIMYDRQTESLWQQFTGTGIVGTTTGQQLTFLPSSLISYANFKDAYPDGKILSRDTGNPRNYGNNPYAGYDTLGRQPFLFNGEKDERLDAVARVTTVHLDEGNIDIAYPLTVLEEMQVINDVQGEQPIVVFHLPGTSSALGKRVIALGEDVGATGVFDPVVNGQTLTFSRDGDVFVDAETGTTWNIVGHALDGELAGEQLEPIVHADHFWFSW